MANPSRIRVSFGATSAVFYTDYHAEQFVRALTLNGTPFAVTVEVR